MSSPQSERFTSSGDEALRAGWQSCTRGSPLLCTAAVPTGRLRCGFNSNCRSRKGDYGSGEKVWELVAGLVPEPGSAHGQRAEVGG